MKRSSVKPREYFVCNKWDFNVAGYIFEIKMGKSSYIQTIKDYVNNIETKLFKILDKKINIWGETAVGMVN